MMYHGGESLCKMKEFVAARHHERLTCRISCIFQCLEDRKRLTILSLSMIFFLWNLISLVLSILWPKMLC